MLRGAYSRNISLSISILVNGIFFKILPYPRIIMAQRTKFRQRQFQKSSPRHFSREDESKGVEGYCPRNYRPCFDWAKEGQDIPMCIPERYSCEDYDNAESYDQQLAEIIEQRKREISLRGGQQYS